MIGSVVEACTSATMFAEVVRFVIIQAAPTACTSPPKFEARLAVQIARKIGILSGASADDRGVAARSIVRPSASRPDLAEKPAFANRISAALPPPAGRDRLCAAYGFREDKIMNAETGKLRKTEGRGRLYDSIVDTIGDTPCVRINRLAPPDVEIYVKGEFFNPAGSVKDRLAIGIIEAAEREGKLKPGQTVVEATSGNTGVGLAMVCAAKGYPLVVTMADSFSTERRQLMRFLGAQVVLTPRAEKGYGMYMKAVELAEKNGWFLAHQFETEANGDIHESTTAREIVADFAGKKLDYFVSGYGTGGTVVGVGRILKKTWPDAKLILAEPANAQLVGSGKPQERTADGGPTGSHPAFESHPIQGWTPDFIPLVLQEAIDKHYYDELVPVPGAEGMKCSRELAAKEGILTGVSGGSTFAAALKVAEKAPKGSVILAMLPDTGERYLSPPLYEPFGADMNDAEKELMRATPGYQLP
jgi:cysteine synthase A